MSAQTQSLIVPATSAVLRNSSELFGRILLAALFLMSGIGKITAYSATAGYMASVGVPGLLLPLVILTEAGGAIALIAGWHTRLVAVLMAGFTVLAALMFHSNFGDQNQMIHFLKNIAIAGAFLMLAANGAGGYSLDARSTR